MPDRIDTRSLDVASQRRAELKALFPSAFTETRDEHGALCESIDFEKLKAELGTFSDVFENRRERYGMDWPGRKDCLKVIQQPSHATLKPCREESVEFDSTENLFIEGDNLEVLKLLQKSYYGKVKMIYIDPPYNTGNEFIYPDNYSESLDTYLAYAGLIDSEGKKFATNTANEGRFHTKWLNMMYSRLYLARNLLCDDGIAFISIDDGEVASLVMLCNEVFGEENRIAIICHKARASVSNDKIISSGHNFILLYAKNVASVFVARSRFGLAPDLAGFDKEDERGKYRYAPVDGPGGASKGNPHYTFQGVTGYFRFSEERMKRMHDDGLIVKVGNSLQQKYYLKDAKSSRKTDTTWWDDKFYTSTASARLKTLMGADVFDSPKPVELVVRMIELWARNEGDVILDFFGGSGTTAHAVMESSQLDQCKRHFILVQLPEPCSERTEAFKAGFKSIADIGKERIRRVIKKLNEEEQAKPETERSTVLDRGFRVLKLDRSNFRQWPELKPDTPSEQIVEQLELHVDHVDSKASPEELLFEVLITAGLSPASKIETVELAGLPVYSVDAGRVLICLAETVTQELVDAVAIAEPEQFLCLDRAFHGNDQLRANASQAFETRQNTRSNARPIVFRTI